MTADVTGLSDIEIGCIIRKAGDGCAARDEVVRKVEDAFPQKPRVMARSKGVYQWEVVVVFSDGTRHIVICRRRDAA